MVVTQLVKYDSDLIDIIDKSFNINDIVDKKEYIKINKKSIKLEKDILYIPISNNQSLIGTAYDYMLRFELNKKYKIEDWNDFISETIFYNLVYTDKDLLLKSGFSIDEYNRLKTLYINIINLIAEQKYIEAYLYMSKIDIIYRSGKKTSLYSKVTKKDIEDLSNLYNTINFYKNINNIIFNPKFNLDQIYGDGDIIIDNRLIDIKLSKNSILPINYIRQLILYDVINEINNNYVIDSYSLYNPRYGYELYIDKNNIDIESIKKYIIEKYIDNNLNIISI